MGLVSLKDGADGRGIAGIVLSSVSLLLVLLAFIMSASNPSTETNNINKTSSNIKDTTIVESNETQITNESEKIEDNAIKTLEDKSNDIKATDVSSKSKKTEYYIGDTLTSNLYDFRITKVTTKNRVGSQYFSTTPSEGGIYVCIEYEYKNVSDAPISMWDNPRVNLIDKKNNKYSKDISASSYYATEYDIDSKILSDLNPGITVKDADVYEISKESWEKGGWTIKVDADKDFIVNIDNP